MSSPAMGFQEAVERYLEWGAEQGKTVGHPSELVSFAGKMGWVLCSDKGELAFVRIDGDVTELEVADL